MSSLSQISRSEKIAELWRRGNLRYKLRSEQKLLRSLLETAPKGLVVFNISRRWGKSTVCATYSVEEVTKKPQKILYATAFLTDLQNFILPIFQWVLQDCPKHLQPKYISSAKEFRFPNGGVIKLVGLDKNPNALRGNNIDILIIDEAAFVKNLAQLYRSIIVPATMKRQFKLIFPSTPPESPEHFWAKELIPKSKMLGTYRHFTIDDISDLSLEEKERLFDEVGGKDSTTARREFYGEIIVDSNRSIAPSFSESCIVDFNEDYVAWRIYGDTGGIRDKSVFLQVGWSHELQKVLIADELVFDNRTPTAVITQQVREKWPTYHATIDAHGQTQVDYSFYGMPTSETNVKKADFPTSLLYLNSHFHLNQVLISPRCKLLLATLQGGLLNNTRTDYERTDTLGHCDAVAALIYGLRGVDKLTDLRPQPSSQDVIVFKPKTKLQRAFSRN